MNRVTAYFLSSCSSAVRSPSCCCAAVGTMGIWGQEELQSHKVEDIARRGSQLAIKGFWFNLFLLMTRTILSVEHILLRLDFVAVQWGWIGIWDLFC
jgi:hypothetical protein